MADSHWQVRRAITVVTAAIVCGALTAALAHFTLLSKARSETARLSRVTATVVEPAVPHLSRPAIGTWTADDGTRRTGSSPRRQSARQARVTRSGSTRPGRSPRPRRAHSSAASR